MKNYIPLDFFEKNKNTAYTSKDACLKKEGSAVSFDTRKLKINNCKIENGVVVIDDSKSSAKQKAKESQHLYNEMKKDVYTEMENVFGTDSDISAAAFAATFEAMLKRPDNYVDEALGFADSTAVLQYANAKIKASDAYGVFRMKRIGRYQAEKAALEA